MAPRSRRTRVASALVCAAFLLGASPPRTFDEESYAHAQRFVDIGGRRLNLYCTGSGSPTVVLDTDGHEGTVAWRYVQPFVARRTRVCSYDAAGFGFSDSAEPPRDAIAFVNDLHALLAHARISSPLILVGYQPSGLYDRLYADRYVRDVAGMVLVDPVETHHTARIVAVAPALRQLFAAVRTFEHDCYRAAVAGMLHPGTRYAQCLITPGGPPLPRALADLNLRQWERPGTWRDYVAEGRSANGRDSIEIDRAQRPYGTMPLIVLTSDTAALQLPIPKSQLSALTKARIRWHDRIASLSSRGTNFIVDGSSDSIAVDDPFAVVSAINEVIDQVRKQQAL